MLSLPTAQHENLHKVGSQSEHKHNFSNDGLKQTEYSTNPARPQKSQFEFPSLIRNDFSTMFSIYEAWELVVGVNVPKIYFLHRFWFGFNFFINCLDAIR